MGDIPKMGNSIKFNLNHIRLGLIELFETATDIYKFYSAPTTCPALSPQTQSVKARQGATTVRPDFTVDYDEERNHKVQVNYSLWPGYTFEIHSCGHIQPIELNEAAALADEIKAALEAVERHKDDSRLPAYAAEMEGAQKEKVELISEFGVSVARAAAETLGKQTMQSFDTENKEALAELCHRQWSGWMRYLFTKCEENEDSTVTIPKWAVGRWSRQMETEYSQLSEDERNSDRVEAGKFLALIEQRVALQ